jgi:hypothetical protein
MLFLSGVLLTIALAAPGDIYRCRDATGAVSFQDHPCACGESARLTASGDDPAASQRALQQWLDQHRGQRDRALPATSSAPRSVRPPYSGGPISEAQLAMCSERFLYCAHGDAAIMDACINQLPRCGKGASGACCPQSCISRYQSLRQDGNALALSVKLALLNPDAPACAAPN